MSRVVRTASVGVLFVVLSACSLIGGDDTPAGLALQDVRSETLLAGKPPANLPTTLLPGYAKVPNLLDLVAMSEPQEDALGRTVVSFVVRNSSDEVAYGASPSFAAAITGEETVPGFGQVVPGKIDPGQIGFGRVVFATRFAADTELRLAVSYITNPSKYFTVLGVEDFQEVDNSDEEFATDRLEGTLHNPTRQPTSSATVQAMCFSSSGEPLMVYTAEPEPPLVPPRATARFDTPILPEASEPCATWLLGADAGGTPIAGRAETTEGQGSGG